MQNNKNKLEEFKQFLLEQKVQETEIPGFLEAITGFIQFLESKNESIMDFTYGKLIDYTDRLVEKDRKGARTLIIGFGLWRYFPFIKKPEYMEELLDIAESSSALDTLFKRVGEWHGETIRDDVFRGIEIPPLGAHPEKKPQVTKEVLKRLEEILGEEKTIDLLRPCLHGGLPADADKKVFHKLKDLDAFLKRNRQKFIKEVEQHRENGTAMFAQVVDDEVVDYVKTIPTMGAGVRENNQIIVTKIPYQIKRFLQAETDPLKRYYWCYCPWVRSAMKDGTETEISRNFCYCSGGFFKLYWDEIFSQSVTVEPVETALWGDSVCKFAIEIPTEIMDKYVKKS
jgi:hypothetical protein